jgi:hypothetical protein
MGAGVGLQDRPPPEFFKRKLNLREEENIPKLIPQRL